MRGDDVGARESFAEAVAADPFHIEAACETIEAGASPKDPDKVPLCDAARAAAEPPFDEE